MHVRSIDHIAHLIRRLGVDERRELWGRLASLGLGVVDLGDWDGIDAANQAVRVARVGGPHSTLRTLASTNPEHAYMYAFHVDKRPHDVTREGASGDPQWAVRYAEVIEEGPHPVTRAGACKAHGSALRYAEGTDKGFHQDTWEAVKDTSSEKEYRRRYLDE